MAKKFCYMCAGVLMLALSYHFGATTATAQAPGNPIVSLGPVVPGYNLSAVAANGDVYGSANGMNWFLLGNVFGGSAPTQTRQESFGAVKARYR